MATLKVFRYKKKLRLLKACFYIKRVTKKIPNDARIDEAIAKLTPMLEGHILKTKLSISRLDEITYYHVVEKLFILTNSQ